MDLVVGVDAGGTGSRAVVATTAGEIVGRGTGGPGNPLGGGDAAGIGAAVGAALSGSDPGAVRAGVLGLAGTSPDFSGPLAAMWSAAGLRCPLRTVGDVITAFAAGTPAPDGTVLIAGTGAIAARVERHEIARTADGFGWLLGDLGSGRWMGLQALRAAVRDWSSPLAHAVAAAARVGTADELVRWAQTPPMPLAAIGGLAPVVCAAHRAGDPAAVAIVRDAVGHLLATLDEVAADGPIVLAGSVLSSATPVRDGVLDALRERAVTARVSHDPAAAAAWLAARPFVADPAALHARLLG